MKKRFIFLLFSFLFSYSAAQAQIITTIAGNGMYGFSGDNGPAIDAELRGPSGIAVDAVGNLYISDNNRIRKINPSGIITTIAGTGIAAYGGDDGPASAAKLNVPAGITIDAEGNIYIADAFNNCIRKINNSGIITTIAGNWFGGYTGDSVNATSTQLNDPTGVAVDVAGNIYIADAENNRIRKVNTSGIITTIAGTGVAGFSGNGGLATLADINRPFDIVADNYGNVYFSDDNHIRKVSATGIISTIAGIADSAGYNGDGVPATSGLLNQPLGIALDANGSIYIADGTNNRIRMVSALGIITTIAGSDTAGYDGDNIPAATAELNAPNGVAVNGAGSIYISDWGNKRVRYVRSTVFVNVVNENQAGLNVYPNPCNGQFLTTIMSGINEQAQIMITNMAGEKVKEISASTNEPLVINIDRPAGVYFINVVTAGGTECSRKVVIK